MMGQFMPFGMLGGGGFTALTIINSIVSGFIGVFILGIIFHIFVYIMGGRNGIGLTIKAVIYGYTPNLLLGWIPIVNFIAMIWTLILYVIGIREYHEISTGKAALAVLLPLILIIIFVTVIFSALLLGMGGGPSSFMMP